MAAKSVEPGGICPPAPAVAPIVQVLPSLPFATTDVPSSQVFMPVVVQDNLVAAPSEDAGLTLVTPQGFRLEIRADFHAESLQRLLKVLS